VKKYSFKNGLPFHGFVPVLPMLTNAKFCGFFFSIWGIFHRHGIGYSIPGNWGKNAYGRLKKPFTMVSSFSIPYCAKITTFFELRQGLFTIPGFSQPHWSNKSVLQLRVAIARY
jgi:hypothetical protein